MRPSWPTRPCATQDVAMNVKCEMSYWSRYPRSGCWGLIIAWNITDVFDGTWWSCHIRPAGLIDTQQTQVFIDTVGFCVRLSISRILTQQSSITRFSNGRTYTGRSRSWKAGPSLPNGKGKLIEYLLSSDMVGAACQCVARRLMDPVKWMGKRADRSGFFVDLNRCAMLMSISSRLIDPNSSFFHWFNGINLI